MAIDGHLSVLKALADSFRHVPPVALLQEGAALAVLRAFVTMFNSGGHRRTYSDGRLVTDMALALANRGAATQSFPWLSAEDGGRSLSPWLLALVIRWRSALSRRALRPN